MPDHSDHVARFHMLRAWSFDLVPKYRAEAAFARLRWAIALRASRDPRNA